MKYDANYKPDWKYQCDWCGKKDLEKIKEATLYDCGLTGYTKTDEVCDECYKKYKTTNDYKEQQRREDN